MTFSFAKAFFRNANLRNGSSSQLEALIKRKERTTENIKSFDDINCEVQWQGDKILTFKMKFALSIRSKVYTNKTLFNIESITLTMDCNGKATKVLQQQYSVQAEAKYNCSKTSESRSPLQSHLNIQKRRSTRDVAVMASNALTAPMVSDACAGSSQIKHEKKRC